MISNIYAIYLLVLLATLCKATPKEVQKCRFGDEKCIIDSMNYVVRNYRKGIPKIGLKPIDVVDIGDVRLVQTDFSGATWYAISLTNQVNYGFENTTITKVEGFEKDPRTKHLMISGHIPCLVHKGDFDTSGKVWVVTMNMSGVCTTEFQNLRFKLKLKVGIEYQNNKRYLNIYDLVPLVKIDRWNIWLEDLFSENTDMRIIINKVFNDHWLLLWNEWEPQLLNAFAGVFLGMIKGTFDKVPYDELFLPDPM